jgi:hypothetical protein
VRVAARVADGKLARGVLGEIQHRDIQTLVGLDALDRDPLLVGRKPYGRVVARADDVVCRDDQSSAEREPGALIPWSRESQMPHTPTVERRFELGHIPRSRRPLERGPVGGQPLPLCRDRAFRLRS